MKKLLIYISLFLLSFTAEAQLGSPQQVYEVSTRTQMQSYFGQATRIYVDGIAGDGTSGDYILCPICTVDNVKVFSGAGGRKWNKITNSLDTSYVKHLISDSLQNYKPTKDSFGLRSPLRYDSSHKIIYEEHQDGVVSGGIVTYSGHDTTYYISPSDFFKNGIEFFTPFTQVKVRIGDATHFRIDQFYVDTIPVASVIPGTPATNPLMPQVNPRNQIALTTLGVTIAPNDSVPQGYKNEVVWNENDSAHEWIASSYPFGSMIINYNSTANPFIGLKSIYTQTYNYGSLQFTKPSGYDTAYSGEVLSFWIYSNGTMLNPITVYFQNGSTVVSNVINLTSGNYGMNPKLGNTWMNVVIPFNAFQFTNGGIFNVLKIGLNGVDTSLSKGLFIDYIRLLGGISNVNNTASVLNSGVFYVKNIAALENYTGNYGTVFVQDSTRGGLFNIVPSGVPDSGIIFKDALGRILQRQWSGNIQARWFGTDDTTSDVTNSILLTIAAAKDSSTIDFTPGQHYTVSGSNNLSKYVSFNMNGATFSATPLSDCFFQFLKGGEFHNGTFDNVFVAFSGDAVLRGLVDECNFINETYQSISVLYHAKNVSITNSTFSGGGKGPGGVNYYACLEGVAGATNVVMDHNYFFGCISPFDFNGETLGTNYGLTFSNNIVDSCYQLGKIGTANSVNFINNTVSRIFGVGFFITATDSTGNPRNRTVGYNINIDHNLFRDFPRHVNSQAIYMSDADNPYAQINISNNAFKNIDYGIVRTWGNMNIHDNYMYNGVALLTAYDKVYGATYSGNISITNNTIDSTRMDTVYYDLAGTRVNASIILTSASGSIDYSTWTNNVNVSNNTFINYGGAGVQVVKSTYSVYPQFTIDNNYFKPKDSSVSYVNINTASYLSIFKNHVDNSIGSITGQPVVVYDTTTLNSINPVIKDNSWQNVSSQPSTGTHIKGEIYRNTTPSLSGGAYVQGWQRLTSGTQNVAGVDWATIGINSTLTFSTGLTNRAGVITSNLSTGSAGGQAAIGGVNASDGLVLKTTTNATKGKVYFDTTSSNSAVYDAVNLYFSIGNIAPTHPLEVKSYQTMSASVIAAFYKLNNSGSAIIRVGTDSSTNSVDLEFNSGSAGPFRYGTYTDANIVNNRTGLNTKLNFVNNGAIRATLDTMKLSYAAHPKFGTYGSLPQAIPDIQYVDSVAGAHSGTVTSIATTAPVTGGTITSTGTIGVDTTKSQGRLATYNDVSLNLPLAGGTMTGTITSSAASPILASGYNTTALEAQFGTIGLQSYAAVNDFIFSNLKYNSGYKYLTTNPAAALIMGNGDIYFDQAVSGTAGASASMLDRFHILNANGNIGLGTAAPTHPLEIKSASASITNAVLFAMYKSTNAGSVRFNFGFDSTVNCGSLEYNSASTGTFVYGTYGDINIVNNRTGVNTKFNFVNNGAIRLILDTSKLSYAVNPTMALKDSLVHTDKIYVDSVASAGTYLPTLTNTTNVSSSLADTCTYSKSANIVTVGFDLNWTPTAATTQTVLTFTLPIAVKAGGFPFAYWANGTAFCENGSLAYGGVIAATVNGTTVTLTAYPTLTTPVDMKGTFQYRIN